MSLSHRKALAHLISYFFPTSADFRRPRAGRNHGMRGRWFEYLEERTLFSSTSVSDILKTEPLGGTSIALTPSDFTAAFTEPNSGAALTEIEFTSLPSNGTLTLNGSAVTANQLIDMANVTSTNLVYTQTAGFTGSDVFTWLGTDGVNDSGTTTANITIQVPPISQSFHAIIPENQPYTLSASTFMSNFIDGANGTLLTNIEITALPTNGNLTLSGSPVTLNTPIPVADLDNLTYTPTANYTLSETFAWNGNDGTSYSATSGTVTFAIVNPAPSVSDITIPVYKNNPTTLTLDEFASGFIELINVDNTIASIQVITLPTNGTLALSGTPVTANQTIDASDLVNLTYTPNSGFAGSDTFEWTASDDAYAGKNDANVTLTITVPTVTGSSQEVAYGQPVTFMLSDFQNAFSDAVANSSLQSITFDTVPANGTLTLDGTAITANETISASDFGNLTLTYQPDDGFAGVNTFTWNASDGFNLAATAATVSITVDTPYSVGNVSISEPLHGTSYTFTLADFNAQFTDTIPMDTLGAIQITSLPSNGTLTLSNATVTVGEVINVDNIGNLTYTQTLNYAGTDSFGWNASNGTAQFATHAATVTLTVPADAAPTLTSVTAATKENTPLTFSASIFTAGFADTDPGDSLQQLMITTLPVNGTLTLDGNAVTANQTISVDDIANLVYTPNTGYIGNDAFGWNASDGQYFAASSAAIAIADQGVGAVSETEALHATSFTFAANDFTPIFGDDLQAIEITSLPTNGKLTLNGTAVTVNQQIAVGDIGGLVYTQTAGFTGTDSFKWDGSNGTGFSGIPATVSVTVPADSRPTLAPVTVITTENLAATFSATTFSNGFTDADSGDVLQAIQITSLPTHGKLTLNGTAVTVGQTIATANLAGLTYTPTSGYIGSDSFKWNASDGYLFAATTTTATLTVAGPAVANIGKAGVPGTAQTLGQSDFTGAFSDALAGDTATTVQVLSLPAHGTLTLNGQAVTANQVITLSNATVLTYTPAAGYVGADSFRYNASDGHAYAASAAAVNFIVDNAPTLAPLTVAVVENVAKAFTLANFSANFSDVDAGSKLQAIEITSLPANGTLTLNGVAVTLNQVIASGSIAGLKYTPTGGTTGADSFGWNGSDGLEFAAASSTVTLNVNALPGLSTVVLPAPVVTGGSVALTADEFTASFNDSAASLQSVKITSLPAHGTLTLNNAKVTKNEVIAAADLDSLVYTSKAGYLGEDSFGWTGSDGSNYAPGSATVQVAVVPLFGVLGNSQPILNNQKKPTASNFTDFGSWTVLADPSMGADTRTYTITNSSNASITLGAITLSNTADFTLTDASAANTTLAAGASATFTVAFNPSAVGKRTATVTIANSSAASPTYTFAIQGTALHTTAISTAAAAAGGVVQEGTSKNGSGVGASNGQILVIEYTGYLADGTVFDSSSFHAQTINGFPLRLDNDYADSQPYINQDQTDPYLDGINSVDGGVIAGWEYGLQGIKAGESRTLVINAAAGYGSDGSGTIPGGATLIFDVKCVSIVTKPRLGVVAELSSGGIVLVPGQNTASASDGTLMTVPSGASSVSQAFELDPIGTVSSTGAALGNWTFRGSGIKLTGDKKDFGISYSNGTLTVTFHPTTPGTKTATIHVLTSDPVNPDFTFNVQGSTASIVDVVSGFSTLKFPTQGVTSGTPQKIKLPVVIENIGNSAVPAKSMTNIQIYAVNASSGTKTLLTTENNVSLAGLGVDKVKHVNFTVTLPATLVSGSYEFEADVNQNEYEGASAVDPTLATFPEVSTTNNNATTTTAVLVVQGTYSLSGSLGASTLANSASGVAGNLSVSIRNTGTIALPSSQQVSVQVIAHPVGAPDTSTDVVLNAGMIVTLGALGAGGSKSFTIPVSFSQMLGAGQYDIEAILTPTQTLAGVTTVAVDANSRGNPVVLTA